MPNEISRKDFFKRLGLLGISAVSVSTFLEACGGNNKQSQTNRQVQTETQPKAPPDPCTNVSGLTETELKTRKNLQYVGQSPFTGKYCGNCNFFIEAKGGKGPCGTCQVVKGPINPMGHCTAWVAKSNS